MEMKLLEGADISLVKLTREKGMGEYPYCKLHGAMNMVSQHNYWRCIHTYSLNNGGRFIDNNCRAGCVFDYFKHLIDYFKEGWKCTDVKGAESR